MKLRGFWVVDAIAHFVAVAVAAAAATAAAAAASPAAAAAAAAAATAKWSSVGPAVRDAHASVFVFVFPVTVPPMRRQPRFNLGLTHAENNYRRA